MKHKIILNITKSHSLSFSFLVNKGIKLIPSTCCCSKSILKASKIVGYKSVFIILS